METKGDEDGDEGGGGGRDRGEGDEGGRDRGEGDEGGRGDEDEEDEGGEDGDEVPSVVLTFISHRATKNARSYDHMSIQRARSLT
ncbi:hypothetical protein M8J75_002644 [Diaphorina citri]|nr:hypothetical protein M8J75_002644 [Diaphorina citri]